MGLVFPHLKSHPFAVGVTVSVVLGEECLGLLLLAVGVEPLKLVSLLTLTMCSSSLVTYTWGLWKEPGSEENNTWEHSLEPDGDNPRCVTR